MPKYLAGSEIERDAHAGPVPDTAWLADDEARKRGRVQIFNATRPGGLDGWTMDEGQYTLVREHILQMLDEAGGPIPLQEVVDTAQARFDGHPAFPGGRLTNYVRYTKTDLEARCELERLPGSPQRIVRWRDAPSR